MQNLVWEQFSTKNFDKGDMFVVKNNDVFQVDLENHSDFCFVRLLCFQLYENARLISPAHVAVPVSFHERKET